MKTIQHIASVATGVALLASVSVARAQAKVWDFSITDTAGDIAKGQLVTGAVGYPYQITGISGTFDTTGGDFTVTGLSGYAAADNLLYQAFPYASFGGISFNVSNSVTYNWSNYPAPTGGFANTVTDSGGGGCCQTLFTSVSVSAVPELSTWGMMLAGFAALGFAGYRRASKSAVVRADA